jgi:hypothetical protein
MTSVSTKDWQGFTNTAAWLNSLTCQPIKPHLQYTSNAHSANINEAKEGALELQHLVTCVLHQPIISLR